MKKRTMCLVLAVVMMLSMLSGCAKPSTSDKTTDAVGSQTTVAGNEDDKTTEGNQTTEAPKPELEEATIQLMIIGPGPQQDTEKVMAAFNEMLQEYVPNTTVELIPVLTSEYKDNFNRMLASEEPVDLAWVGYATSLNQDMIDGNLMPLDDLLNEYGQGIVEVLGADVLDLHRHTDGKLYYTFSWQGLLGNKFGYRFPTEFVELVEKKYPNWLKETREIVDHYWNEETTVENLELWLDQAEKYYEVLKENGKLYGGHANTFNQYGFNFAGEIYIYGAGGVGAGRVTVLHGDETFTVIDSVTSEFEKAYFARMAEWYQKGYIHEDALSRTWVDVKDGVWQDNNPVIYLHNLKTESEMLTYEANAGVDFEGVEIQRKGSLGLGNATGMGIPYCANEPERAMMVLNALYTVPELYQLFVYGIEGEHYTKNNDGTITHVGLNDSSSPYGLANWFIGTCANTLPDDPGKISFYDDLVEAEKDAISNPFIGFKFDITPVADAVAALNATIKEYSNTLYYGVKGADWEAYYNEYLAARKAAGIDRVIEECQRQLNEYIKANNITGISWD